MSIKLIGLSGNAGAGKDYIGKHYLLPLGFHPFSLAWHFKVWLVGKGEATHDEVFHSKPPHIRKKLQLEGTEFGRNKYGDAIWLNTAAEWIWVLHEYAGIEKFYIPDVRFPNEVEFIRQRLGGKIFRIHSPIRVSNNGLTEEARNHPSETSLNEYHEFEGTIFNDPDYESTVNTQVLKCLEMYNLLDTPEPTLLEQIQDYLTDLRQSWWI